MSHILDAIKLYSYQTPTL